MNNKTINYLTIDEINSLNRELIYLEHFKIPSLIEQIAFSVDTNPDLRENSSYDELIAEREMLDQRIFEIKSILVVSKPIPKTDSKQVRIGKFVKVKNISTKKISTFHIVSELESDPLLNKISTKCAIGAIILGKKVGFQFKYNDIEYKILGII